MADYPINVKYDVILDAERERDMPTFNEWNFIFTVEGDVVLDNTFTTLI